ncbi:Reticuline oxidase [Mycena indigotica]|uniref:Reticuline oxidase n=1 Tax=Mycena indigotica TaxID=2126181 RepID=A0A8H6W8B5_9AGAR|nr:Reticuline oxidase [Mycena indigotica]KAF7309509.1 Reticuline oxidase [Mycena indigotica]
MPILLAILCLVAGGLAAPANPTQLQTCLNQIFNATSAGSVHYPSDALYQLLYVKAYNTDIPVTPVAITQPKTVQVVSNVVQCAAASGVKVQPRSGGHSYGNYGIGGEDGAVVVDLVYFQKFMMDNTTWQATIGAGTLLADVTSRLHNAGKRAIAHGTCPQVGIGGHATIGGLGPISRQWGSTLDHVLEVEIVLANGTIIRANSSHNPDVFWAVKGAAASFGIVTEFVFRTHPEVGNAVVYSYKLLLGSHASHASTFAAWQSIISDANLDRRLASQVIIFQLGMIISGTFFGSREEFNALNFTARLSGNSTDVAVSVLDSWLGIVGNWAETEALKVVGGISGPFYSKSLAFKSTDLIAGSAINEFFAYLDKANKGTLIWFAIFDVEGGAINDVAQDATAYAHRDAQFYLQTYAIGIGSLSDATRTFVQTMSDIITRSLPGLTGAYAGYVDPRLTDGQQQYWGTNLPRLQTIKAIIDPDDVFHNPQSVRPVVSKTPSTNTTTSTSADAANSTTPTSSQSSSSALRRRRGTSMFLGLSWVLFSVALLL